MILRSYSIGSEMFFSPPLTLLALRHIPWEEAVKDFVGDTVGFVSDDRAPIVL